MNISRRGKMNLVSTQDAVSFYINEIMRIFWFDKHNITLLQTNITYVLDSLLKVLSYIIMRKHD